MGNQFKYNLNLNEGGLFKMCGICGFSWDDKELLKNMNDLLEHRGPNQKGSYSDKGISLGHRRLSILDLSERASQPLYNEDKSIVVVCNGEVYNHKELRENLEIKGHRFYTETDAEVIAHLFEDFGKNCVQYMDGMFAFAIWDGKKLFLVRDRLGIKPLYYCIRDSQIIFASEIKSILAYKEIKRGVDYKALNNFLTFRYGLDEDTMFNGIKKLLPGHTLVFEDQKISIEKYWDLKYPKEYNFPRNSIKKFHSLLGESVRKRLMGDVPIGVFLSGGIDSSSLVHFTSKYLKNVNTFTIGYGLKEYDDELKYARAVADHYSTNHHEIIFNKDPIKCLSEVVSHMDLPLGDPSALPLYLMSKKAKEHVSVVLSGDGADEQLGGYEWDRVMFNCYRSKFLLSKPINKLINLIGYNIMNKSIKHASLLGEQGKIRLNQFCNNLDNHTNAYLSLTSIFDTGEKNQISSEITNVKVNHTELVKRISKSYFYNKSIDSFLNRLLLFELKTKLPNQLLMKLDNMTMAHSIEARVPFLDYKLVEFVANLPIRMKVNSLNGKIILKKAMHNELPPKIIQRKKEHFFVPIHIWFDGELMDVAKGLLSEKTIKEQGLFNYKYIERVFDNYKQSKLYYARQLWCLINFQLWYRTFIEETDIKNLKFFVN